MRWLAAEMAKVGNELLKPPLAEEDRLLDLLGRAETLLSKVEQSPHPSMLRVLAPVRKGLVSGDLLRHRSTDVRVALASCLSEITRITAPLPPYRDELMKVIFSLIVEAFGGLNESPSRVPSYRRRLSILETVAKVRSCVVMLDLDCERLILEMFRHLFCARKAPHPEGAYAQMETVLTVVVEESYDFPSKLIRCLLDSVRKENEDADRELGESVIGKCGARLRQYLLKEIRAVGASLSDYSGIVASVCNGELNAPGLEDGGKQLQWGFEKLDMEWSGLEDVVSNGVVPVAEDGLLAESGSPSVHSDRTVRGDSNEMESLGGKADKASRHNAKESKSRKDDSPVPSGEISYHPPVNIEKDMEAPDGKETETTAALDDVKVAELKLSEHSDDKELLDTDDSLYDKLQEIITEVEKLKYENFQESCKWHKAEKEATEAKRKIKDLEIKISREIKLREQADEALITQKADSEALRTLQDETTEELKVTQDYKKALEAQLVAYNSRAEDLEEKLLKAQDSINLLNREREEFHEKQAKLQKERGEAVIELQESKKLEFELRSQQEEASKKVRVLYDQKTALETQLAAHNAIVMSLRRLERERDELQRRLDEAFGEMELQRSRVGDSTSASIGLNFVEFSRSEIEQATRNFESSMKIGGGGYGSVYKGFLRYTAVAIKVINPLSLQDSSAFHREVEVLSRLRHPNLVTLMGTCLDLKALANEYLPNGSLADHLMCKNGSPPLSWQARTRICAEICLALMYLHSGNVVHGDLKPENVLLGASFVSKLSDFGISHLLIPPTTTTAIYDRTDRKGTFVYRDPEVLSTGGMLTPKSDVYAFGILILCLVTGKQPFGIVKKVQDAVNEMRLHEVLDPRAGKWPFVQAQQLIHLGLRCSAVNGAIRPDLATQVLIVLEPMTRTLSGPPLLPFRLTEDNNNVPSYFICPIFQEVMRDPQVAADGFTYEAEAIKGWLEAGHDTSPMTNIKLLTKQLIPNHSLRSTIQEWLQQCQRH